MGVVSNEEAYCIEKGELKSRKTSLQHLHKELFLLCQTGVPKDGSLCYMCSMGKWGYAEPNVKK